jgi:hypothetical protein
MLFGKELNPHIRRVCLIGFVRRVSRGGIQHSYGLNMKALIKALPGALYPLLCFVAETPEDSVILTLFKNHAATGPATIGVLVNNIDTPERAPQDKPVTELALGLWVR